MSNGYNPNRGRNNRPNHHGQNHRGGQQNNRRGAPKQINAPYTMIPCSNQVLLASEQDTALVSHEMPFRDGFSGSVTVTLENTTELLIGADQSEKDVWPAEATINGQSHYRLPGASLRGMLRHLMDITMFAKLGNAVDDLRYTTRPTNQGITKSKQSGWLYFEPTAREWRIQPCDHQNTDVEGILNRDTRSATAESRYEAYAKQSHKKKSGFEAVFVGRVPGRNPRQVAYWFKAFNPQAVSNGNDLILTDKAATALLATKEQNVQWKNCEPHYNKRFAGRVPVFYKPGNSGPEQIWTCKSHREANKVSTHELIKELTADHFSDLPDWVELIMGYIDEDDGLAKGLKSRVSVLPAFSKAPKQQGELATIESILRSPKGSWEYAYLEQKLSSLPDKTNPLTTHGSAGATIAGRKDFPTHQEGGSSPRVSKGKPPKHLQQMSPEQIKKNATRLHAVPEGHQFQVTVNFHNLRHWELGAVLWALTLGDNPKLRHRLGMGKPYGMGQLKVLSEHTKLTLTANNPHTNQLPNSKELLTTFTEKMEQNCSGSRGWDQSITMRALRNSRTPGFKPQHGQQLEYMHLDEFTAIRKSKGAEKMYQPNYAR